MSAGVAALPRDKIHTNSRKKRAPITKPLSRLTFFGPPSPLRTYTHTYTNNDSWVALVRPSIPRLPLSSWSRCVCVCGGVKVFVAVALIGVVAHALAFGGCVRVWVFDGVFDYCLSLFASCGCSRLRPRSSSCRLMFVSSATRSSARLLNTFLNFVWPPPPLLESFEYFACEPLLFSPWNRRTLCAVISEWERDMSNV